MSMKDVLTFLDYLYNPHSNKASTPSSMSRSSSSSSSEIAYTSSGSFTDEEVEDYGSTSSSSSSSSSSSGSLPSKRYRRNRSSESSSSIESYYDDKDRFLMNHYNENEDNVMNIVAKRFNVKKDGLHSTYRKFKYLVYDQSDKGHLFCGIRLLSPSVCENYGIKQYDDSEYACLFHNINHNQPDLVHLIDSTTQKNDTYLVAQQLHDSLYYTITRALVIRIINILRSNSQTASLNESKNLIKTLKDEMPNIYTKYSTSHIHCKQRHANNNDNRKLNHCMNNQVIYTKTTSKLYAFIKQSLQSTKLGIDGLDANLKFDECELALPIPFYLVLFLCGKAKGFRSEFNMKLNNPNMNQQVITTTNNDQGESIVDFEGNTVDRYIDYEKWICLPSWCLVMYQNAK